MFDQFKLMANPAHPAQERMTTHQKDLLTWGVASIERLRAALAELDAAARDAGVSFQHPARQKADAVLRSIQPAGELRAGK